MDTNGKIEPQIAFPDCDLNFTLNLEDQNTPRDFMANVEKKARRQQHDFGF